jgi:uncharacterized membrane protein
LTQDNFLYQLKANKVEPFQFLFKRKAMQGLQRRVVYITLYEGIAIVVASAGLALMTDAGRGHAGRLAVAA